MGAIPEAYLKELSAFPPILRALLDEELEAGNEIVGLHHAFPAPPVGACVKLARPVTTRPRQSGNGLAFRAFNSSLYSGEFTDDARQYFVTEAPLAPPDEPDMDAIRAAHDAKAPSRAAPSSGNTLIDRFRASMQIDYEKWHDGIGYDVALLADATESEKDTLVSLLVPPEGWRDVEALAAINNAKAVAALKRALTKGNVEVRTAVTSHAPWVASDDERTALLVNALEHGVFYEGLTSALDQVESFHPKPIVDALFRGLFVRPGEVACHFAAMLSFLHGKADSSFDWELRPLFLRFNSEDGAERRRAFHDLCTLLELDPAEVLQSVGLPLNH